MAESNHVIEHTVKKTVVTIGEEIKQKFSKERFTLCSKNDSPSTTIVMSPATSEKILHAERSI